MVQDLPVFAKGLAKSRVFLREEHEELTLESLMGIATSPVFLAAPAASLSVVRLHCFLSAWQQHLLSPYEICALRVEIDLVFSY